MTKFDVKTVGNDVWDIRYDLVESMPSIRVWAGMRRPNRKWYQTKYIATNSCYVKPYNNPSLGADYLVESYYAEIDAYENLEKFFEENY